MKYRNGFVSNSSSASFIVAVNESVPCKHCGRSDMSILDLIDSASNHSGETEVRWTDPRDHLIELEEEIVSEANTLMSYAELDDDDVGGYQNRYKISQLKEWAQNAINSGLKEMAAINAALAAGKRVICFDVDYHDDTLNAVIQEQISNNTIEVIKENG
jgi:hypothetical protein